MNQEPRTSNQNLVLIGMRGSGKSAIGRTLAKILNFEFADVDEILEGSEKMTIPAIVEKHGWDYFRDLETKYTQEVAKKKNCVISTGGGVILREENMESLKKNGEIIFIHSPIKQLAQRVAKDSDRPSLTGKTPHEELEEIWQARKELYRKYADCELFFDFETDDKEADLTRKAEMILEKVEISA